MKFKLIATILALFILAGGAGYLYMKSSADKNKAIQTTAPEETPKIKPTPKNVPVATQKTPAPSSTPNQTPTAPTPKTKASTQTITVIPDSATGARSTIVERLTGEYEVLYNKNSNSCEQTSSLSRTETTAGLKGTDLGVSIKAQGKNWFFFGDSIKSAANKKIYPGCSDTIAYASNIDGLGKITLTFLTDPQFGNAFLPTTVPGTTLGCFDVPSDGVVGADNSTIYAWFTDDNGKTGDQRKIMYKSYLAKTADPSKPFTKLYDLSTFDDCYSYEAKQPITGCLKQNGRFVDFTADTVGNDVYIIGGGGYRKSDAYLAKISLQEIEDKSAMRYFSGLDQNNAPTWSPNESSAAKIIDTPGGVNGIPEGCIGEVSFKKVFGKYLVFYNCSNKILANAAENPWGPWSAAQTLFDPNQDNGYCNFIYKSDTTQNSACSCLNDGINKTKSGGVYGPFIIEDSAVSDGAGGFYLNYTMSTWNPYNVSVMKTHLKIQ